MSVKIVSKTEKKITLQLEINLSGSILEMEESILSACNDVGCIATEEALKKFDVDGSPIVIGDIKLTSKGAFSKTYQTPYGEIDVKRHVYQTSRGGKTYCPLEMAARIIRDTTPRFAKILSNKYARMPAPELIGDLEDNHGRKIAISFLQNVADEVASIAQLKEESWEYVIPEMKAEIKTVVASLDGAHLLMHEHGYRESMVGTISLYNYEGERQHTIYIGASPEYGKAVFLQRLEDEINRTKKKYPAALWIGLADGAKDNWSFLEKHTEKHLIDFYHATEYIKLASDVIYGDGNEKGRRKIWLDDQCHQLKHEKNAVENILIKLQQEAEKRTNLKKEEREKLKASITYFTNNKHRMNYWEHVENNLPIGSGVTEAACKTLVKYRLCASGMRWKDRGIKTVMSLRSLVLTKDRWKQFWEKILRYGAPNFQICTS